MNLWIYIGGTLFIYLFSATLAIFIQNLGVVFEVFAAITKTSINFIWPGLFFILADNRYGGKEKSFKRSYDRFTGVVLMCAGFSVFSLVLITTILDHI